MYIIMISQLLKKLLAEIVSHATFLLWDYFPVILLSWGVVARGRVEPYTGPDLCLLQVLIYCL